MPEHRRRQSLRLAALTVPTAALLAAALYPGRAEAQVPLCEGLSTLALPNTVVTVAQTITAGTFTPPGSTTPITNLPAFCRVAGTIAPTTDSAIGFEVWMPVPGSVSGWNGRYLQNGNGGFAGTIPYTQLAAALRRGFASSGTDDGHTGSGLDATWALGHPEKITDFGYRAVHETALKSAAIIATYFGNAAARSYFVGCSDGGREGMVEIQRYPSDFDGWVIGAPAYNWAGTTAQFIWDEQAITATPGSALPNAKLQLLSNAVTTQCDALDGVTDGVVANPRVCRFDPGVLQCAGADGPTCLTADQVAAVRKIYAGPRNPRTGQSLFPGFEKGAESNPADWPAWITNPDGTGSGSAQRAFAYGTGADIVFNNPNWDYRTFNFDSDYARLQATVDPVLSALDTDLARFSGMGKKIIHYHGWADTALSPLGSINYYRAVAERLNTGASSGSLPQIASFYRLFMAPGMAHCSGGVGPNVFGQAPASVPPVIDPQYDMVSAIVRWVEQGAAPDQVIATKYVNDTPAQGVLRTLPLCPYPQAAQYNGSGNPNSATSYRCTVGTVGGAASQ